MTHANLFILLSHDKHIRRRLNFYKDATMWKVRPCVKKRETNTTKLGLKTHPKILPAPNKTALPPRLARLRR